MLCAVSYRDPASIHTPTVAVLDPNIVSEATRRPLGNLVISVVGAARRYDGKLLDVAAAAAADVERDAAAAPLHRLMTDLATPDDLLI